MNIGDKLIQKIITKDSNDGTAYDLLNQILKGYPIENISTLLKANTIATNKSAVWILSELGRFENGYFDLYLNKLIDSECNFIRYYTLEYTLAYSNNIDLINKALRRLNIENDKILNLLKPLLLNIKNDSFRIDFFKKCTLYVESRDAFNELFKIL